MIAKLRRSVLAVLWAWVGFVVAGLGFQKMIEYDDFVEVAREKAVVGAAFDAVVVGAIVTLLAVSVGGLPVAYAALRGAFAEGRKDVPLLFVVPLLALVVFVGYTLLLMRVIYPSVGPLKVHASLNVAFFLSLVAVFLLAAIASTAVATRVSWAPARRSRGWRSSRSWQPVPARRRFRSPGGYRHESLRARNARARAIIRGGIRNTLPLPAWSSFPEQRKSWPTPTTIRRTGASTARATPCASAGSAIP
jgi:hypothetical protein